MIPLHLNNLLHQGIFQTLSELMEWYKLTLDYAIHGSQSEDELAESVFRSNLQQLVDMKAIRQDQDGVFYQLPIGQIASWFYLQPSSVKYLRDKAVIADKNDADFNREEVMCNLLLLEEWFESFNPRWDKPIVEGKERLRQYFQGYLQTHISRERGVHLSLINDTESVIKLAMILGDLLHQDKRKNDSPMPPLHNMLTQDVGRSLGALKTMAGMKIIHGVPADVIDEYALRFRYGVSLKLIPLVRLRGIGRVFAQRLWEVGIRTPADLLREEEKAKNILGDKRYDDMIAQIPINMEVR